jgi:hypothetical protein
LKRDQFDLFQIEFSFAILLILSIAVKDWAKPPLDHVDPYHLGIRFVGFLTAIFLRRFIFRGRSARPCSKTDNRICCQRLFAKTPVCSSDCAENFAADSDLPTQRCRSIIFCWRFDGIFVNAADRICYFGSAPEGVLCLEETSTTIFIEQNFVSASTWFPRVLLFH